jgi:16S rRNA (cytosine967-C5)-methyltransferase
VISEREALERFDALWARLFTTRIHLDSALAKEPFEVRARIAEPLKLVLRRPVSVARALDLPLPPGEPWSLSQGALSAWAPAHAMAQCLLSLCSLESIDSSADVFCDFPPLVVDSVMADLGEASAKSALEVVSAAPPTALRAARSIGRSKLADELVDSAAVDRAAIALSPIAPFALVIRGHRDLTRHPSFERGAFEIQDEGAQVLSLFAVWPELFACLLSTTARGLGPLVSPIEAPRRDKKDALTVVDACAGAGGKTLAIADALENRGRLFAYDVSSAKLGALRRRARRAGMTNVKTVVVELGGEEKLADAFRETADIVLVDAPCSGWGVLRRNPDAKWRVAASALERLEALQTQLLGAYAELVRPGGRLIYGVCTMRREETTERVRRFLESRSTFMPIAGGFLGPGPTDGFFMQAFQRRA